MSLRASRTLVRALGAVVIVTASLGLAACADDDESAQIPAATTPAAAGTQTAADAGPGTKSGLGTERYKALDAVYVAALPFDEIDEEAPLSDSDGVLKGFESACNKLETDDALLASYRRFCPLVTDLRKSSAAVGACESSDVERCLSAVTTLRRVAREFVSRGASSDRAVQRAMLTPACGEALKNPDLAYEVMRQNGRAMAYLQRALKNGSLEDSAMAERILQRADARSKKLPTAKEVHEDFKAGCA